MSYLARIACLNAVSSALSCAVAAKADAQATVRPPMAASTIREKGTLISGNLHQLFDCALGLGDGRFPHLGAFELGMSEANAPVAATHDVPRCRLAVFPECEVGR